MKKLPVTGYGLLAAFVCAANVSAQEPVKQIDPSKLTLVFATSGGGRDSAAWVATQPIATNWGFAFVDPRAGSVIAIDTLGRMRWRVGTRGSGPLNFSRIIGLVPRQHGGLLIVDGDNRKLNLVSESGELRPPTNLGSDVPMLFSAAGDTAGNIIASSLGQHPMLLTIDETAHVVEARSIPLPGIDTLPILVVASWVFPVSARPDPQVAFVFPAIEQILLLDVNGSSDGQIFPVGGGHIAATVVEHDGIKTITSLAKPFLPVPGAAVSGTRIYVLTKSNGVGLETNNVEVYDLVTRALVQRIVLPMPVSGIAVGHGLLLGVRSNDKPAVVAWRLPR